MLKKTITFTDFNGETQTEDFYFHLTKADVAKWELSERGGTSNVVQRIVKEEDPKKLLALFEEIVERAYGRRSDDGKRFLKSPALYEEFKSTGAYDELFVELISNAEESARFFNGIMPPEVQEAIASNKSASDLARERSEAMMQGHKEPKLPDPEVVEGSNTEEPTQNVFQQAQPTPQETGLSAAERQELEELRALRASSAPVYQGPTETHTQQSPAPTSEEAAQILGISRPEAGEPGSATYDQIVQQRLNENQQ